MMKAFFLQKLVTIEDLKEVPESQLEWLVERAECRTMEPGEFLFKKGVAADHLYIILSGRIRVYIDQNGGQREITQWSFGSITGVLPYSRMKVGGSVGVVTEQSHLMCVHRDHFPEMIQGQHELTETLVHLMTSRVREFTAFTQQNEKMMALGKLSAGLAHELNNPSSAVIRSAQELKKNLKNTPDNFKKVILMEVNPAGVDAINDILFPKLRNGLVEMPLITRSGREDELAGWMEDHGIADGFDYAPNFTDYDFGIPDLEKILSAVGATALPPVVGWINSNLVTEKLVDEIEMASRRIASLVNSIKSYSHMDRSQDKQAADIHTGIRNTLTLLQYKLRNGNIQVVENFATGLPQPKVFVSELNQVWTNLIDNAIDAMEGRENSRLEIRTEQDGPFIKINFTDNGPGIPEEMVSSIFDPFFTTKDVGKGTGLGLDIVSKIVRQHNGTLRVKSVPGKTDFEVCLPLDEK